METVGNVMLLISTATLLLPFVYLFFAVLFKPESKKQDTQKLNIEVEALKNTCFKHIAEIEVRLKKLESECEKQ